jgi:hypothetical protein
MTHIIENSGVNDIQRLQMQENITTFEDILGGCERLLRTPIPVSYTRHTSRFLLIWLTILPYALWAKLAWATVPAVAFIALLLLGVLHSIMNSQKHLGFQLYVVAGCCAMDARGRMKSILWCEDEEDVLPNTINCRQTHGTGIGAGIEEIGVEIEDPFGILPLEVISNKAKADIIEILNREDVVKDVAMSDSGPAQEAVNGRLFTLPQINGARTPVGSWAK